ncbi:uncharacterized protein PFL1_04830 [Pseudozyma flocculosa PF-1]|uniref:NADAR domain-containing protein n=2 Tax=Pseudozyma flocculosa TaxID=84751 RepID=A0A5C3F3U6_9BASI|nr:uncharacterized protein PFL1_04830 [Pseudozyma flocculosa PF-1]EPQ27692.1 hypothetical protein PFL1_04830 [Pseudozyma flocculosa PF-1]SPO39174.1 uncharacterized protein PSFLO_04653 [Pseudozyma flocculosa]
MAATTISPRALDVPGHGVRPPKRLSLFKPKTWSTIGKSSSSSQNASASSSRRSSRDHGDAAAAANNNNQAEASSSSSTAPESPSNTSPPTSVPQSPSRTSMANDLVAKPDDEGRIHFFHRGQDNFWLSNSSDHAVYSDNVRYPTAEHLFQSTKFLPHRPEIAAKVRKASNPIDAIKVARKYSTDVKPGWIKEGLNVQAMRDVLLLKFTQHSDLRMALLETGDAELVNASPTDAFWGAAGNGRGRNELGKAIETVRETIQGASGLGIGSGARTV